MNTDTQETAESPSDPAPRTDRGHTCAGCGTTYTGLKAEHCTGCHETFSATRPGDMHRVGTHGVFEGPDRRRCLTEAEMLDKGMTKNNRGYWTTGRHWEGPSDG